MTANRTGEKCCLNFKPCGLFGKELHKVEGYILDKRSVVCESSYHDECSSLLPRHSFICFFLFDFTQQKESMCAVWEMDGVHVSSGSSCI